MSPFFVLVDRCDKRLSLSLCVMGMGKSKGRARAGRRPARSLGMLAKANERRSYG